MCVCCGVCAHESRSLKSPEMLDPPEAGVLRGCEPPDAVLGLRLQSSVQAVHSLKS